LALAEDGTRVALPEHDVTGYGRQARQAFWSVKLSARVAGDRRAEQRAWDLTYYLTAADPERALTASPCSAVEAYKERAVVD